MNNETLPNTTAYLDEPDSYKETRNGLLNMMNSFDKLRKEFNTVANMALMQEHFQDRTKEINEQLCQTTYLLGEMYGFTMADDIIENVELKKTIEMEKELTTAQESHIEIATLEDCKQHTKESMRAALHLQKCIGKLIENDFVNEMFEDEIREVENESYKILDLLAKIMGHTVINSISNEIK